MGKLILSFLVLLLTACSAQPTPTFAPTISDTPIPSAQPTATIEPTQTPIPGTVVIPIEEMAKAKPWLETESNRPSSYFVYFNVKEPPFDNVLVRKAFAAATDRVAVVAVAEKYNVLQPQPATTITPALILGRELYNQIGIPYDPEMARQYLTQAGYSDGTTFPAVTFLVRLRPSGNFPAYNQKVAEALVAGWKDVLGVDVTVLAVSSQRYSELMGTQEVMLTHGGWVADVFDPDNFLKAMFRTNSPDKLGNWSNSAFDSLIDRALLAGEPAERQAMYIQAETILCEEEIAVIPLYHSVSYIP